MLGTLIEKLQRRQTAAVETYGELVASLASDDAQTPDAEHVAQILAAAGKTSADLTAAVKLVQRRRQLAATWADLPSVEAELQELDSQLTAVATTENADILAARERGREARLAIRNAMDAAQTRLTAAHNARVALAETMPPDAMAKLQPLMDEIRRVRGRIDSVEAERIRLRVNAALTKERDNQSLATIAALEGTLAALNASVAEVEAEAITEAAK